MGRWFSAFVLYACALFMCAGAYSLDRSLQLDQLTHRRWVARDYAPANVTSLAQTADGLLWLGTPMGLYWTDGMQFEPHARTGQFRLPSTNISAMRADGASLWLGFQLGGVTHLQESQMTSFGSEQGLPEGAVHALDRDSAGTWWAATSGGLARLQGQRWETLGERWGVPAGPVLSVFVDRQGSVWVATADAVLNLVVGATRFEQSLNLQPSIAAAGGFAQAPDGGVWLSAPGVGIVRVDEGGRGTPPLRRGRRDIRQIYFDRDSSLWIAEQGLGRIVAPLTSEAERSQETLTRTAGLSSNVVHAVMEDREGNIWAGTAAGIDRLTPSAALRISLPWPPGRTTLVPGDDATVWISGAEATALLKFVDGKLLEQIPAPPFTAGIKGHDGEVWFGGREGVARWKNDRLDLVPLPAVARDREVQAMVQDRSGALWVSIHETGVFRWAERRWLENGGISELPRAVALSAAVDSKGDVWFGYAGNRLARVSNGTAKLFTAADGLDVGAVTALHATAKALWIGGELALMAFDGAGLHSVRARNCQPFTAISGMTRTSTGDLWMFRGMGLTRVDRAEQQLLSSEDGYLECATFIRYEGVPGFAQQLRPTPSIVKSSDERLWLAASDGVASLDPQRVESHAAPPVPKIVRLNAADRRFLPNDAAIQLPAHTRDLRIHYTATSLTIPEMVRFRYRLDGFDTSWRAAGRERQGIYTNLGPGVYRIRVAASHDNEHWSSTEASMNFEILPAFYQTSWFKVLCVLAALLVVAFMYWLQMRRATQRLRSRLEERMLERERIARELHDTLLQGLQALILRFHAIALRIPEREPLRDSMERALERADEVLVESRDKVKDLRDVAGSASELSEDIAAAGAELAEASTSELSVTLHGTARSLHLIAREEIFRIAREALANAFRHARAEKIEVDVRYERAGLRLNVRDDGCGIDEEILRAGGRSGHWGLLGMRERARKLGASLQIYSREKAGTELDLRVPAVVAYSDRRTPRRMNLEPIKSKPRKGRGFVP